jgi:hypothetical protein
MIDGVPKTPNFHHWNKPFSDFDRLHAVLAAMQD